MNNSLSENGVRSKHRGWQTVLEVLLVFFVFAVFGSIPVPAVNEAHYLTKAKHYWNPDWLAGDLFLESKDAHWMFYWSFGWVTQLFSLHTTAWIGRLLTWFLLACAWQRLSHAVVGQFGMAVLTAAMFCVLMHWGHMAGEWVIGGVEAKGFAYALVFLGLERLIRGSWRLAFLLMGAAAAFHVLTGGWAVVASMFAWCLSKPRLPFPQLLPALLGGLILSLPGLLPALALTYGMDRATQTLAQQIYVYYRLPHHLVFHMLAVNFIVRHAALAMAFVMLAACWRHEERHRRLAAFVLGAILIALLGVVIDLATLGSPELGASLLRYYWFRLSDAMVPLGLAIMVGPILVTLMHRQTTMPILARIAPLRRYPQLARRLPAGALLAVTVLLAGLNAANVVAERVRDPRPGADVQALPAGRDPATTRHIYHQWRAVTDWIRKNTPEDAVFLTPRAQQTFKWYAGRNEVVNWKDVPQDAENLVTWYQRMEDVFSPRVFQWGYSALSDEEIVELAARYDADYLVLDRTHFSDTYPLGLPRVYPAKGEQASYEVYQVARQ